MSSLSDEFQIVLLSNVGCNPRNKPNQYETALAKPLDLPGKWDVALIDIAYPHNWTNLVKTYQLFLVKKKLPKLLKILINLRLFRLETNKIFMMVLLNKITFDGWEVNRSYTNQRGKYDIEKIIEFITTQFHLLFENKTIYLKMNLNQYRVEFTSNVNFEIACYAETSFFQLLGLGSQSSVREIPGKDLLNLLYSMRMSGYKQNCLYHLNV